MNLESENRHANEVAHGKWLITHNPEEIWNWASPAGKLRFRRRVNYILNGAAPISPGDHILEIGCGVGQFTEEFAKTGAQVTAVEISPELIGKAKERFAGKDENVVFICSSFEDIIFTPTHLQPDQKSGFDAVIGSSVLHHLDYEKAVARIFDLLAPGGRMSFCEPNILNPQVWAERKFSRFFPYVSPDETAFYAPALRKTLETAGFINIQVEPYDWLHPKVPEKLIPHVKAVERFLERTPLVRQFAGSLRISAMKPL